MPFERVWATWPSFMRRGLNYSIERQATSVERQVMSCTAAARKYLPILNGERVKETAPD